MVEKKTGVSVNRKRERPRAEVDLTTPHGANVTVSAQRAETFLKRPAIRMGDGVLRKYVEGFDQDTEVPAPVTKAQPPRTGTRTNTGDGE